MTLILLGALLASSLSFFGRAANNMQMTGYTRDSAEAVLLAESALNNLFGQFVYNQDIDGDGNPDNSELFDLTNPDPTPLRYAFFVSTDTLIDQTTPQILQRVSNGEALGAGATTAPESNLINNANAQLQITDLFISNTARPIVFELDVNNLFQVANIVTAAQWTAALEANPGKIAISWLELVNNPNLSGSIQVYAQSIAIVGKSKSYVQRLIGEISTTINGGIPTISQAG